MSPALDAKSLAAERLLRGALARNLIGLGERIKAAAEQLRSVHPENPDIHTINQTEFAGPMEIIGGVKTSKNVVVASLGRLDRCPCGIGMSARIAPLHARGELAVGEKILPHFDPRHGVRLPHPGNGQGWRVPAVVPELSGCAWLIGVSHYGTDLEDPFPEGYRRHLICLIGKESSRVKTFESQQDVERAIRRGASTAALIPGNSRRQSLLVIFA